MRFNGCRSRERSPACLTFSRPKNSRRFSQVIASLDFVPASCAFSFSHAIVRALNGFFFVLRRHSEPGSNDVSTPFGAFSGGPTPSIFQRHPPRCCLTNNEERQL